MFERFTDISREVIVLAQKYANEYGNNFIGTEHVLLALIEVKDGLASKILSELGVKSENVRDKFSEIFNKYDKSSTSAPQFTPRVKRVLEISLKKALELKKTYISTEHILLGIITEGEGVAMKILADLGVTKNDLIGALASNIDGGIGLDTDKVAATAGSSFRGQNTTGSQLLDKFSRNLTAAAKEEKLDPVIGRKTEVERIMQILSRRTKNNPILIGEPGVGKTAVVEGLAQSIVKGDVPETLKDKQIYSLDLGAMVAGTSYRGQFEDRLKKVMTEITSRGDIILFIDEIHTLVGAGNAEGSLDAASILKPMLARGELQTIGATTLEEYRKYFEKDSALERRFQPIKVNEPSVEDAILILKGLRDRYESHHRVIISDEAIEAAVKLSARYLNDRFLPDKAIDLIDEAGARLRISKMTAPPEIREMYDQIAKKKIEIESAVNAQNFELAAKLKGEAEGLDKKRIQKEDEWKATDRDIDAKVDEEAIAKVLEMATGIPVYRLTEEESKRLLTMETELHKRVVGQDEAISALARSIRRTRAGLKDPKRPSGSFIFAGPTGVGKTELAKALSEFLFGDESSLIQVDMSEYGEKHTTSRLFGAPPGFVGYEDGGQLTEKIRRKPFSVVLFDEIEKAHPDIFNTLLQVLEDGHLTDSTGRLVDFKNTVIIMTTNLGSGDLARSVMVGFADDNNADSSYDHMKARVREDLKKNFRPEFLNRIDDVIVFPQLKKDEILQIVDMMVDNLWKRLADKGISAQITQEAKELLATRGYDPILGARPLRRTISRDIEDYLSEKILYGELKNGDTVKIGSTGTKSRDEFTFEFASQNNPD
ncbi:MAG: ATP-dependent Clp protease ATP-binding subunit [Candidatus Ancillula sp.]|jgi:ATP-dependent Clp protease ATP-binding subunit ClpC|nr:ATP-dependent Clp protease ATP-binding subunit [Candidatus Ancillula sp.]